MEYQNCFITRRMNNWVRRPINLFRRINNTHNVKGVRISNLFWAPLGVKRDGDMLIQSTLTRSTKLSRYIESPLDNVVLVEYNLHELDGTCEWNPIWRGSLAIYEEDGGFCYSCFCIFIYWSCIFRLGFPLLFSKVALGVPERESHLLPWEASWESLFCIAPHPGSRPSIILQSQCYFYSIILLSCRVL